MFRPSNTTSIAEVVKADVNLSIDVDDVLTYDRIIANINLYSLIGNGIDGTVILTIKNKDYEAKVVNGNASFEITDYLSEGDYEVIAYYVGSNLFYNATSSDNFTVSILLNGIAFPCRMNLSS